MVDVTLFYRVQALTDGVEGLRAGSVTRERLGGGADLP